MEEIREYIDEHPELKRPFYHVPHREGIAGTAAQFVLHVSDRMDKSTRFWKRRTRGAGDCAVRQRLLSGSEPAAESTAAGSRHLPIYCIHTRNRSERSNARSSCRD